MGDGQSGVFVEVETRDIFPGDVVRGGEGVQHFELGGSGGDDDVCFAAFRQGLANERGTSGGGAASAGEFVRSDVWCHWGRVLEGCGFTISGGGAGKAALLSGKGELPGLRPGHLVLEGNENSFSS